MKDSCRSSVPGVVCNRGRFGAQCRQSLPFVNVWQAWYSKWDIIISRCLVTSHIPPKKIPGWFWWLTVTPWMYSKPDFLCLGSDGSDFRVRLPRNRRTPLASQQGHVLQPQVKELSKQAGTSDKGVPRETRCSDHVRSVKCQYSVVYSLWIPAIYTN